MKLIITKQSPDEMQTFYQTGKSPSRFVRLRYRLRYYFRKLVNFIGLCHRCGSSINYTRHGKAICPKCGK